MLIVLVLKQGNETILSKDEQNLCEGLLTEKE